MACRSYGFPEGYLSCCSKEERKRRRRRLKARLRYLRRRLPLLGDDACKGKTTHREVTIGDKKADLYFFFHLDGDWTYWLECLLVMEGKLFHAKPTRLLEEGWKRLFTEGAVGSDFLFRFSEEKLHMREVIKPFIERAGDILIKERAQSCDKQADEEDVVHLLSLYVGEDKGFPSKP